ncbi:mucin-5AC-like [Frankliniella occidentalis]|uniref:Mucin-5AC-like n=1 Tax=Frankliniella occidentalis TaxID=133901 RepID=A0A9C6WXC3_FRAOC|nr:mucin-5AC-like [Frankliniella occidentalis]
MLLPLLLLVVVAPARPSSIPAEKCPQVQVANGNVRPFGGAPRREETCYRLFAERTQVCVDEQRYSDAQSACVKPPRCPNVGKKKLGRRNNNKKGASVARFWCGPGYRLHGHQVNVCNGRRWNGTTPTCRSAWEGPGDPPRSCNLTQVPAAPSDTICGWTPHGFNGLPTAEPTTDSDTDPAVTTPYTELPDAATTAEHPAEQDADAATAAPPPGVTQGGTRAATDSRASTTARGVNTTLSAGAAVAGEAALTTALPSAAAGAAHTATAATAAATSSSATATTRTAAATAGSTRAVVTVTSPRTTTAPPQRPVTITTNTTTTTAVTQRTTLAPAATPSQAPSQTPSRAPTTTTTTTTTSTTRPTLATTGVTAASSTIRSGGPSSRPPVGPGDVTRVPPATSSASTLRSTARPTPGWVVVTTRRPSWIRPTTTRRPGLTTPAANGTSTEIASWTVLPRKPATPLTTARVTRVTTKAPSTAKDATSAAVATARTTRATTRTRTTTTTTTTTTHPITQTTWPPPRASSSRKSVTTETTTTKRPAVVVEEDPIRKHPDVSGATQPPPTRSTPLRASSSHGRSLSLAGVLGVCIGGVLLLALLSAAVLAVMRGRRNKPTLGGVDSAHDALTAADDLGLHFIDLNPCTTTTTTSRRGGPGGGGGQVHDWDGCRAPQTTVPFTMAGSASAAVFRAADNSVNLGRNGHTGGEGTWGRRALGKKDRRRNDPDMASLLCDETLNFTERHPDDGL